MTTGCRLADAEWPLLNWMVGGIVTLTPGGWTLDIGKPERCIGTLLRGCRNAGVGRWYRNADTGMIDAAL